MKVGKGGGGGIIYLSLHCHTGRTPALRWAALKASLVFH